MINLKLIFPNYGGKVHVEKVPYDTNIGDIKTTTITNVIAKNQTIKENHEPRVRLFFLGHELHDDKTFKEEYVKSPPNDQQDPDMVIHVFITFIKSNTHNKEEKLEKKGDALCNYLFIHITFVTTSEPATFRWLLQLSRFGISNKILFDLQMGNSPDVNMKLSSNDPLPRPQEGEVEREILRLKQTVDKTPDNGAAFEQLGQLYYKIENFEDAQACLERAYQIYNVSPNTLYLLGCFAEENKQNYEAIDYFKECLTKEETYAEAYHKLADIFLGIKDLDKAIHYATECSKYKQSDVELNNLIGLCYFMKGNLEKAHEYLQTAYLINQNHFRVLNNLGNLSRRNNKIEKAIDFYKLAIKNMPTFYPAFLNLGLAYFDKGDVWNAIQSIKESRKGGPEIQESISRQGLDLFIQDDLLQNAIKFWHEGTPDIAVVFLEQSFKNNSNNIVTLYYAGLIKYSQKDYEGAHNLFNKVINGLTNYYTQFNKTSWYRFLGQDCVNKIKEIMEKNDDTVSITEIKAIHKGKSEDPEANDEVDRSSQDAPNNRMKARNHPVGLRVDDIVIGEK